MEREVLRDMQVQCVSGHELVWPRLSGCGEGSMDSM